MATYSPVVNVNITINSVSLAQAGFGIPLFVDAHQGTDDRVFSITSPDILLEDKSSGGYGMTTDQPAYKAAVQYFNQSPSVDEVKIGRRASKWDGTLTNYDDSVPSVHEITVSVPHIAVPVSEIFTATAEVAVTSAEKLQEVADDINTNPNINPYVLATADGVSNLIVLTPVDTDITFTVTDLVLYSGDYSGFEDASTCISEIRQYDDDWYFISTHDRTIQWVLDVADVIQASEGSVSEDIPSNGKMYFHASGDSTNYETGAESVGSAGDDSLFNQLSLANYDRTVSLYQHTAETYTGASNADYPECAYVGYNAPFDAGTVTWANLRLRGVEASKVSNTETARYLNTTEKNNVAKRNGNFHERDAGIAITRFGISAGNEWIDSIRGVDWLTSEVETSIKELLYSQQGGKVAYTNQGIAQVRQKIMSALQSGVNRGFLASYELFVPLLQDVLSTSEGQQNWINRVLSDITFVGFLAGAIHTVEVRGSVQAPTLDSVV